MPNQRVGQIEVRGTRLDLIATPDGEWYLVLDERTLSHDHDFVKAKASAARTLKKMETSVAVPFRFRDGTRGVGERTHIVNNNVLATCEDGSRVEVSYREEIFNPETPRSIFDRLDAIDTEMHELKEERRDYIATWGFDVRSAVRSAVAEASTAISDSWTENTRELEAKNHADDAP